MLYQNKFFVPLRPKNEDGLFYLSFEEPGQLRVKPEKQKKLNKK